jgi:hypothetical protein
VGTSKKVQDTNAKYKTIRSLREQSADLKELEVDTLPWRKTSITARPPGQVSEDLQEIKQLLWPVDSGRWDLFKEDNTKLNPNAFKRIFSLLQTVVNLQGGADKARVHVLKEITSALYFCEFAGLKYGSIKNFLAYLCLYIHEFDYVMESHIDEKSWLGFCRENGYEKEAASILFALVKKEVGGRRPIVVNDFMSLYKYIDKSIMEIHRWAINTKALFPYKEEIFFKPPRIPPRTFAPLCIWLFPGAASATRPVRGYPLHVQKSLGKIERLFPRIKQELPQVMPFGANIRALFCFRRKLRLESYMELEEGEKYVVSEALLPVWDVISPAIENFVVL